MRLLAEVRLVVIGVAVKVPEVVSSDGLTLVEWPTRCFHVIADALADHVCHGAQDGRTVHLTELVANALHSVAALDGFEVVHGVVPFTWNDASAIASHLDTPPVSKGYEDAAPVGARSYLEDRSKRAMN